MRARASRRWAGCVVMFLCAGIAGGAEAKKGSPSAASSERTTVPAVAAPIQGGVGQNTAANGGGDDRYGPDKRDLEELRGEVDRLDPKYRGEASGKLAAADAALKQYIEVSEEYFAARDECLRIKGTDDATTKKKQAAEKKANALGDRLDPSQKAFHAAEEVCRVAVAEAVKRRMRDPAGGTALKPEVDPNVPTSPSVNLRAQQPKLAPVDTAKKNDQGQYVNKVDGGSLVTDIERRQIDLRAWHQNVHTYLLRQVNEQLKQKYGSASKRRAVTFSFDITRDGKLDHLQNERSSGSRQYDADAAAALAKAVADGGFTIKFPDSVQDLKSIDKTVTFGGQVNADDPRMNGDVRQY